jgi:hypothetical protein
MHGREEFDLLQARVIGASRLRRHQNCVRAGIARDGSRWIAARAAFYRSGCWAKSSAACS